MKKILLCPGNVITAKSYPYWDKLVEMIKGEAMVTRIEGILPEQHIIDGVNWCDVWISIDSFLPHLVAYRKLKPGIVLWGTSDPLIFGYPSNTNLLKDRKYLREHQFLWWATPTGELVEPPNPEAFVKPEVIVEAIHKMVK